MPLIGRSVKDLEGAPVRWVALHDPEDSVIEGAEVGMRQLPRAIHEQILRPALRMVRKGGDDENAEKAIERFSREVATRALDDTRGFEWSFDDAASAKEYAEILGVSIDPGVAVCLDGRWTPALRERFFADHPVVVQMFVAAYRRLTRVGNVERAEEEEGKGLT